MHWTCADNPILTPERLREIETACKKSPFLYKRDWLGERVTSLCAFCPLPPQNEATGVNPVALAAGGSEQCLAQMQHF